MPSSFYTLCNQSLQIAVIAECAAEGLRDSPRRCIADAARGHAAVRTGDHHADIGRISGIHHDLCDIRAETLL